ncbi:MAG: ATP-binding protein [Bdellovibrionota bacterium]
MADYANKKSSHKWPRLALAWHKSIVMRSVAIAILVLFFGFVISTWISIQSIKSISGLAHDSEIEESLEEQLQQIKNVHKLRQQLITERLQIKMAKFRHWNAVEILNAVKSVSSDLEIDVEQIVIKEKEGDLVNGLVKGYIDWPSQNKLEVWKYELSFPKGEIYNRFKSTKEIQQRYHLMGVELDSNIRPTLIKANILILVIGFFFLIFAFFQLARRFRVAIQEVLDGFEKWSLGDFSFRFLKHGSGEIGLITQQFNAMAEDVEVNRQKTLYLEKIASWQVIARKLAHEIKNPLTPIQMMVSQLQRRYKGDDEEFSKLLNEAKCIISEEVAGLRRMVDNFSDFAQLPTPKFKETNLVDTVKHVADLQQAAFHQHQISAVYDLQTVIANVDEDLIRQVLINLTKNAAEASEIAIEIKLGVWEEGNQVVLKVMDTGPGIPDDIKKRIFEAYFTTKHTGPTPGMGLGLAICQKIILDHHGEISVESKPGKTAFSIFLPKQGYSG